MNHHLKASQLPKCTFIASPISDELKTCSGIHSLQSYYPGLAILGDLKTPPVNDIWLDHSHRVTKIAGTPVLKSSSPVSITVEKNVTEKGLEVQDISGFRKITHLLDPIFWIQGKYSFPKETILPWHQESWGAASKKLQDPMNQAYVEAVATYAFGKLREGDYTPHFHLFYGAFCGIADTYAFNITDSYMSYRHMRWFWNGQKDGRFIVGFDKETPTEVKEAVLQQPDEIHDSSSEEEGDDEESVIDTLITPEGDITADFDKCSLHSTSGSMLEENTSHSGSESDSSHESDTSEDSDCENLNIYTEIKNFPVMVIYTESSEGTMDDLLDDYDAVKAKPGTKEWDTIWTAWIFQVIAALTVGQSVLGFTHNDLHSNNIVWSKTEKPYIFYKTRDGISFKVPTFGRIFRIIDFGRSIFHVNEQIFFSDDFKQGNDAADQYNFKEILVSSSPEVYPNPSFDLSRFTVSVFESLFPTTPAAKAGGALLSQEPGLKVKETESDLYNLLWSWLICEDGHNVLMEPDGRERYPDFDLYKVIASKVHSAVPSHQVRKPIFEQFRVAPETISQSEKVYSLFC